MRHHFRTFIALSLCALWAPVANGSPDDSDESESEPDAFNFDWEDATDNEGRKEFDRLMSRGRQLVLDSAESYDGRSGADRAMQAADLFTRAAKLSPEDPKPHLYAAEAIRAWDNVTYTFPKRIKQTIYHLSEFIRLAPYDSRVGDALFNRSIAYTKLGGEENIRKALADYDVRLAMENQLSLAAFDRAELALILSNSAELYMYVGDLDKALALYYDSLEYASGQSAILYKYGLAVALDRDGQRLRAATIMRDAVRHTRKARWANSPAVVSSSSLRETSITTGRWPSMPLAISARP